MNKDIVETPKIRVAQLLQVLPATQAFEVQMISEDGLVTTTRQTNRDEFYRKNLGKLLDEKAVKELRPVITHIIITVE